MKNLWQNKILSNQAGDANGGGGSGAGSNSILTPSGGGGTPPATSGNASTSAGTNTGNTPPANTNASGTTSGTPPQDWRAQLPPELQEDAAIKKFGSLSALAAGYVSASKLIGKDKIPVPGQDTSDEQWQEIFQKLGVPKEVKDYSVKFKDGVQLEEKFTEEFKTNAHKLGILPKQAQALADWFSDINLSSASEMQKADETRRKAGVAVVQQEWGQAFQAKASRVNKFIAEHGGPEAQDHFFKSGLGADPIVLKVLSAAADKIYKEGRVVGDDGAGGMVLSPKEAMAEANKIIGDTKHPYHLKDHPGHKEAVAKVQQLFGMAVPKKAQ